jgi:thiosulfate reductase cytochrome b subunit
VTVRRIHPLAVRITHWTNAVAVAVMIASGGQIYNASLLFPFVFPSWLTLGHWLGGALAWHFAAMWLLAVNFASYLAYGVRPHPPPVSRCTRVKSGATQPWR